MMEEIGAQLVVPVSDRDHIKGPATAPVTLVEYGDYECPYCGLAYVVLKEVEQQLGDRVRFVFRHFPLTNAHPHAFRAAEAAEAAGAQGRFWPMHDTLYEHQQALDDRHLFLYAEELGLDPFEFERAMAENTFAERIRADFMGGVRSGVNGTPTFFINGVRHDGSYNLESMMAALEAAGA
jgi:protein-disulfide isomerase